ncbi:TIGR04086 family membrane protein [Dorea sp.]|nr:TIGR04086 family membrane protein [uncultured Dorea sp.]
MPDHRKLDKKITGILKALLISYAVTGILLMILAFGVYKLELQEGVVTAGIKGVYLLSSFTAGCVAGKALQVRRFIWGIIAGSLYFVLLLLITLGIYRTFQGNTVDIWITLGLCAGGGMAGGMIS